MKLRPPTILALLVSISTAARAQEPAPSHALVIAHLGHEAIYVTRSAARMQPVQFDGVNTFRSGPRSLEVAVDDVRAPIENVTARGAISNGSLVVDGQPIVLARAEPLAQLHLMVRWNGWLLAFLFTEPAARRARESPPSFMPVLIAIREGTQRGRALGSFPQMIGIADLRDTLVSRRR